MGLLDTLLGRKMFCDVCGAPIRERPIEGRDGALYCSQACMATLGRLSRPPDHPSPDPSDRSSEAFVAVHDGRIR